MTNAIKPEEKWDVFISHSSEDKENFVEPLAKALSDLGVKVWYDKFSLKTGDSLTETIDKGPTILLFWGCCYFTIFYCKEVDRL